VISPFGTKSLVTKNTKLAGGICREDPGAPGFFMMSALLDSLYRQRVTVAITGDDIKWVICFYSWNSRDEWNNLSCSGDEPNSKFEKRMNSGIGMRHWESPGYYIFFGL